MGKKKHRPGRKAGSVPRHVGDEFHAAERPMRGRRRVEADPVLEPLALLRGDGSDILEALLDVYAETGNFRDMQETCERLIELRPSDPDLMLGLAGAYMANIRPVLALQTFRRFLERWPNHEEAPKVRATVAELEPEVEAMVDSMGFSGDDALELAALHERAASHLEQGNYGEARKILDRLLRRHPDFAPGLNNLGQIYALEGRLDRAIETAERVLTSHPDNVHALSNLTRYLVLSGRLEDAAQEAERLKAIESDQPDLWVKKVEALSYLGDDQGVLDVLEAAQKERGVFRTGDPLLYHLGAVAAMRLGREKEARRYWKQALELAPGLEVAEDNLEDLDNPVGERHAPWPFDFANWAVYLGIVELVGEAERVLESGDESEPALSRSLERYLRRHPEIAGIIPRLLDAGDPTGREFALRTAMAANTPEMLAALKDFALGQRGSDELRMEAAQAVSEAGLLSQSPVRLWQRGEWREVRLVRYDIHDEPLTRHSAEVEQWHAEAHEALNEGDGERAERLLERALQIEPDDPSLLYNLSVAYTVQQREEEAEALLRDLHQRDPDHLFARVGLARRHLQRDEIDEGKALLDPLRSRRRFHFAEFNVFCMAQIDLHLAEGNQEAAESWFDLWADSDPDHPAVDIYRRRLRAGGQRHALEGPASSRARSGLRQALFRRR